MTVLPDSVVPELRRHLRHVRLLHEDELAEGSRGVSLLHALAINYWHARRDWTCPRTRLEIYALTHPNCSLCSIHMTSASQQLYSAARPPLVADMIAGEMTEGMDRSLSWLSRLSERKRVQGR